MISPEDEAVVAAQLGRPPRGLRVVAHRCPCGLPDVVETAPRLPDGTPFPTLYYLTCPKVAAAISGLESSGLMREMTARLAEDEQLRSSYQQAHRDYVARRDAAAVTEGLDPLPSGTQSAGGMPDRVKCLHALAAHELAVPGTNSLGREALDAAGHWWSRGPCTVFSRGDDAPHPTVILRGDDPPYPPMSARTGPDRKNRDRIRPGHADQDRSEDQAKETSEDQAKETSEDQAKETE